MAVLVDRGNGAGYKEGASSAKIVRHNSPTRTAHVSVNLTEVLSALSAAFPMMPSFSEPLRAAVLEILLYHAASLRKEDSWEGRVAVIDAIRAMLIMPMAPSTSPSLIGTVCS